VAKDLDDRWYYNVDTGKAERGPARRGFLESRLGPYETQAEAERGLAELKAREKRKEDEDRAWEEG